MEKITILGTKKYEEPQKHNYGDCIIIDTGEKVYIYDCGSKEHAETVMAYMEDQGYDKAVFILSHNDSDHFNGLPELLSQNKIDKIYTTLLLKYSDDILERIDDKRRSKESVKQAILDKYDNIAKLTGAPICDIYEENWQLEDEICIVGPDKEYMLDAVAKNLDGREGNTTDGETNVNATSIQVKVTIEGHYVLFDGDASYTAIEENLDECDVIQLPHHGKSDQAGKIFEQKDEDIDIYYLVSDNTGGSNGGSDDLDEKGHKVFNTKNGEDICIDTNFFEKNITKRMGCLG